MYMYMYVHNLPQCSLNTAPQTPSNNLPQCSLNIAPQTPSEIPELFWVLQLCTEVQSVDPGQLVFIHRHCLLAQTTERKGTHQILQSD